MPARSINDSTKFVVIHNSEQKEHLNENLIYLNLNPTFSIYLNLRNRHNRNCTTVRPHPNREAGR